jgi:hypothetical protein
MALNPEIYEYYKRKFLREMSDGNTLPSNPSSNKDSDLLKKIAEQTSDGKSILQNVAGNFISDGVLFLLRKWILKG